MSGYPTANAPGSLPPKQGKINNTSQGQSKILEPGPYHPQERPPGPPAYHPQKRQSETPAYHPPKGKQQPGSAPYRHQPAPGQHPPPYNPSQIKRGPNGFTPGPPKGKK